MDDPQLECDMIMKGGITSGVVYPLAATHLSKKYRFRNVGGASAGAIAASLVAAAELGRSRGSTTGGFAVLDALPGELGKELGDLFQPSPGTAPAYDLLVACIDKKRSTASKAFAVIVASVRSGWRATMVVLVLGMVPGTAYALGLDGRDGGAVDVGNVVQSALLWLPFAAVLALVVAFVRFALNTKAAIEANGFGLCDGHTVASPKHLPLTDWLYRKLNVAAGLDIDGTPLTFGDLWGSAAVTAFDEAVPVDGSFNDLRPFERRALAAKRNIALEVMTTNLTLRRPYRFPFEGRELHFCVSCMTKYFPKAVVDHMERKSTEAIDEPKPGASGSVEQIVKRCPLHPEAQVRSFPRPPDVPVVVAARLSLSFPGLISAVPLHYVDYGRAPEQVELITVWFSDGGIASNFPMHLFDSMWPVRPTFGINLQPLDAEHGPQRVYLPLQAAPRSHPMRSLSDFVHGLLDTMQNWSDVTQLTLPTFRTRLAEIRLTPEEGGMNLHMAPDLITTISGFGLDAATLFDPFDLRHHQRARFAISMAVVDDMLAGMRGANLAGFDKVIAGSDPRYRREAGADLLALSDRWNEKHPTPKDIPRPVGDLRVVPRL